MEQQTAAKTKRKWLLIAIAAVVVLVIILLSVRFLRRAGWKLRLVPIWLLSAASLGLTLVLISLSVLTFAAPEAVGNILYAMLVMVSAPMMCCRFWVLSLFLWACLLVSSKIKTKSDKI